MSDLTDQQLTTEYTQSQSQRTAWSLDGGLLWASGGCADNPCNFIDYGVGYPMSRRTWRIMLNAAPLRFARAIFLAPVIASSWPCKGRDNRVPAEQIEFADSVFTPLRRRAIVDIVRGRDWGYAPFEPIWTPGDGGLRLTELKPLSPDLTTILADDAGRFGGLVNSYRTAMELEAKSEKAETRGLPAPLKAWIYTHDKECGNLYGRSWLENVREAWKDWLDCHQQLQKLGAKLAGIQIIFKSPERIRQLVIDMVKALANGASTGWVESLGYLVEPGPPGMPESIERIKAIAELAQSSLVSWEKLDFGSNSPAIAGLLERLQDARNEMFMGALQAPRAGMEGQHGTKAEAGVVTDTSTLIAQQFDDDIAQQMQPLIDAQLGMRFANYQAGSIMISPPPLNNAIAQRYANLLNALITNKEVSSAIAKYADVEKVLGGLDVPIKQGATFEIKEPEPPQPPPGMPGAAPPVNGNGKSPKPRDVRLAKRLRRAMDN